MPNIPLIDLNDLSAASILGSGGNGVVFHVRHRSSGQTFALKVFSKPSRNSEFRRIWFERDVLLALHHSLLPSLHGIVSTDKLVGFAIDYCPGDNLNAARLRLTERMFSTDIIRFYAVEIVIALKQLHKLGIIYRDLKPENVLIQNNGHIMLLDFGLSTKIPTFAAGSRRKKSRSFVGTEEYIAPEMIRGKGHGFAVDWWGLGIVLYEMIYGRTPFRGKNRKETFRRILTEPPELAGKRMALKDLIGRMLVKDPAKRIAGGEIKRHEFFRGVDWNSVAEIARPPYIPAMGNEWEEGVECLNAETIAEEVFWGARAAGEGSGEREVRNYSGNEDFTSF